MSRLPVTKRWARLGPDNPSKLVHTPRAGVCLSVFVIALRGKSVLLGRPRSHRERLTKGGLPVWEAEEMEKNDTWLVPATHLIMEEAPDRAARRIAHEWTGLKGEPKFGTIQSHVLENSKLRANHWSLCFVYELRLKGTPRPGPWWSELKFFSPAELRRVRFGRWHRDVLEEAGYI